MKDANEVVSGRWWNSEHFGYDSLEQCHACGHKVFAQYDEDGTPQVYRAIEYDEALELAFALSTEPPKVPA